MRVSLEISLLAKFCAKRSTSSVISKKRSQEDNMVAVTVVVAGADGCGVG